MDATRSYSRMRRQKTTTRVVRLEKENSSSVSVCAYITGRVDATSLSVSLFVGVERVKKLKNHGGRCGESGCGTG